VNIGPEKPIPINDFLETVPQTSVLRLCFHAIGKSFSINLQGLGNSA
jgi:hypothetical protein